MLKVWTIVAKIKEACAWSSSKQQAHILVRSSRQCDCVYFLQIMRGMKREPYRLISILWPKITRLVWLNLFLPPLEVFCKKIGFENFAFFTEKHIHQDHLFNKVADFQPAILLKKRLRYKCFPVNFVNFLRTSILKITCERLLIISMQSTKPYKPYCSKSLAVLQLLYLLFGTRERIRTFYLIK